MGLGVRESALDMCNLSWITLDISTYDWSQSTSENTKICIKCHPPWWGGGVRDHTHKHKVRFVSATGVKGLPACARLNSLPRIKAGASALFRVCGAACGHLPRRSLARVRFFYSSAFRNAIVISPVILFGLMLPRRRFGLLTRWVIVGGARIKKCERGAFNIFWSLGLHQWIRFKIAQFFVILVWID